MWGPLIPLVIAVSASPWSAWADSICKDERIVVVKEYADLATLQAHLDACNNEPSKEANITVQWSGSIFVQNTIDLPSNGSVRLFVYGVTDDAEAYNNGSQRLFAYGGSQEILPEVWVDIPDASGELYINDMVLSGGNNSDYAGGAVFVDRGRFFADNVTFRNNSAGQVGGAVFVQGNLNATELSNAIADGSASTTVRLSNCHFENNWVSDGQGGAVTVQNTVSDINNCVFRLNKAGNGAGGGGLFIDGGVATVKNSRFENNSADNGGGVYVNSHNYDNEHVIVEASFTDCLFYNNTAFNTDGGAARLDYYVKTNFTRCEMVGNHAAGEGGAIILNYNASATVSACNISGNHATTTGGGVHLQVLSNLICLDSNITGNIADEIGGGIHAFERAKLDFTDCLINENVAELIGSGIYLHRNSNLTLLRGALVDNVARTGGAAVAVVSAARMDSVNTTFQMSSDDTIQVAVTTSSGAQFRAFGAIFSGWKGPYSILSVGADVVLDSCDFSGCETNPLVLSTDPSETPAALVRNAVLGDKLWGAVDYDSGHAFATAGGVVTCNSSSSPCTSGCRDSGLGVLCLCYEPALSGLMTAGELSSTGKLCLPSAIRPNLSFPNRTVATTAKDPTVTAIIKSAGAGGIFSISVENVQNYGKWTATPSEGLLPAGGSINVTLSVAQADAADGANQTVRITAALNTSVGEERTHGDFKLTFYHCPAGEVYDDIASNYGECVNCLTWSGVSCAEAGNVLSSLVLQPGYWRVANDTIETERCLRKKSCPGGTQTAVAIDAGPYCAEGYNGTLCGVCYAGYGSGIGDSCHACGNKLVAGTVVLGAFLALFGLGLVVAGLVYLLSIPQTISNVPGERQRGAIAFLSRLPWGRLRTLIIAWQIITIYASITGAQLPPLYRSFLAGLSVINLNIGLLLTAGCIAKGYDYYDALLVSTLAPLAALAVLGVTCALATSRYRRPSATGAKAGTVLPKDFLKAILARHKLVILVGSLFLYSSVSTTIFQIFNCIVVGDKSYLRADLSLECSGRKYNIYLIYACVMLLVYPVGIPLLYVVLLFRHRSRIARCQEEVSTRMSNFASFVGGTQRQRGRGLRRLRPRRQKASRVGVRRSSSPSSEQWEATPGPSGSTRSSSLVTCGEEQITVLPLPPSPLPPPPLLPSPLPQQQNGPDRALNAPLLILSQRPHVAQLLVLQYRNGAYLGEPVECMRRLMLTGALVLILPGTPAQSALGCAFCVLFYAAFAILQPLRDPEDFRDYTVGSLIIFFTMLDSLLIQAGHADAESNSQFGVAIVLIGFNVLLTVLVAMQMWTAYGGYATYRSEKDLAFYNSLLSARDISTVNAAHSRIGTGSRNGASAAAALEHLGHQKEEKVVAESAPRWTVRSPACDGKGQ